MLTPYIIRCIMSVTQHTKMNMEVIEMIKQVSNQVAGEIIEKRDQKGLFYTVEGNTYVGIDNRDGNAWTEDFTEVQECLSWLQDEY